MNYYEIVPFSNLGRNLSVLSYGFDGDLIQGQAVLIPLRQKVAVGIVIKKVAKPPFETKVITKLIYQKPVLDQDRLSLAFWMSEYYACSLTTVLQSFLPAGLDKKRRLVTHKKQIFLKDLLPKLTKDQTTVIDSISLKTDKPHLIHGVTGSGKTEIYLRLISDKIKAGQQALVLVPEISLTPQMLHVFQDRFGEQVVLMHSYLKDSERFNNWSLIFENKAKIVIGSRSALFAPFSNLGIIIIDEEHENTYKQDQTPRYNTIKVARKLAEITKCELVLGSATPSIESFYATSIGEMYLDSLSNRIVQTNLPKIDLVDMRTEFQFGNTTIFSGLLIDKIKQNLQAKRQVLLFINRRGMSTFINCRDCGYVAKCPNCDLSLTFHLNSLNLICHHCNYQERIPTICPSCQSLAIKYFGTGTQRVESELKNVFGLPYTIARMDHDSTKKRGSHEDIFLKFKNKDIDILIGTQMITKGWDLPNLGLVGIISADTSLNLPDYNSAEQTFDLITQVSGRTGRGDHPGDVVLQTYTPDHSALKYAKKHDYLGFYKEEIENRRALFYPPFTQLIKLMYNNSTETKAKEEAFAIFDRLNAELGKYILSMIGPSPSLLPKVANKYRWQIVIKVGSTKDEEIIKINKILQNVLNSDWTIDVNPWGIS